MVKATTYKHGEIGDGLLFYQHSLKILRWGLDVGEKCRVYHCLLHFFKFGWLILMLILSISGVFHRHQATWHMAVSKKLARCPQNGEMTWNETYGEMIWHCMKWWYEMMVTWYEIMVAKKRSTATKVSLPPNYQPQFIELQRQLKLGILGPEDLGRKTNWVWNWIVKCLGLGRFRGRVHCETWQWS